MPLRVFITGAGGFVGSAVLEELIRRDFAVTALVNRKNPPDLAGDAKIVRADLFDPKALDAAMAGCDVAIHLVGIIKEIPGAGITFQRMHVEATHCVVEAAQRIGLSRYIHMSALGVSADADSAYGRTKWQGEEAVRSSGLNWTIFRPSMIHGPRGEFMRMEANWARKKSPPFFFMPYFAPGLLGLGTPGRIQPVFVGDVARAFVDAVDHSKSIGHAYCLGGAQPLTWPQMHQLATGQIVGKKRLTMALPAWYAKILAAVVPGSLLPFNRDQVVMSLQDNTCDMTEFERDFGWKPAGFAESLARYSKTI